MTNWTKTTDKDTEYGGGDLSFRMLSEDGDYMLTEDSRYIVSEGPATPYTKTSDKSTPWGILGGLIRLCTEGIRDDMMSEGRVDYIVVSHGEDVEIWTDTSDVSSTWTKISDI